MLFGANQSVQPVTKKSEFRKNEFLEFDKKDKVKPEQFLRENRAILNQHKLQL